jgi:hypothetical protein
MAVEAALAIGFPEYRRRAGLDPGIHVFLSGWDPNKTSMAGITRP